MKTLDFRVTLYKTSGITRIFVAILKTKFNGSKDRLLKAVFTVKKLFTTLHYLYERRVSRDLSKIDMP